MKKNRETQHESYIDQVLTSLHSKRRSEIAEEGASVRKALTLVQGLPSPIREEIFVRLVVDDLCLDSEGIEEQSEEYCKSAVNA